MRRRKQERVSERFVRFAKHCMCSVLRPTASRTTASGLPGRVSSVNTPTGVKGRGQCAGVNSDSPPQAITLGGLADK
ncbi:hypothetical protein ABIB17_002866 [Arthrobacter sp. UYEF6]